MGKYVVKYEDHNEEVYVEEVFAWSEQDALSKLRHDCAHVYFIRREAL